MHQRAGLRLKTAREQRKLSLHDVTRATRIRPDQLHDLENDDYGNFPSPAYARSFLTLYARYLNVDVSQERESFDVANIVSNSSTGTTIFPQLKVFGKMSGNTPRSPARRSVLPVLGVVVLLALLLFSFKLMLDLNRLGGSAALERTGTNSSGIVAEAPAASAGAAAMGAPASTEPALASVGEAAPNRPVHNGGNEEQLVIRAGAPGTDAARANGSATP